MKILLINPPYAATEPPQVPMGLLYISGALLAAGHEVKVLDLLTTKAEKKTLEKAISEFTPKIVGVTSVTMNWPSASTVLKWAKEIDPEIVTVAGGPHATFTWEEIGKREPWVDYVVRSEGEVTVAEFAREIELKGKAEGVAGLAWRENGGFRCGPEREFIKNIDNLPTPARHLFQLSRYRLLGVDGGMSTGRGCPFHCIFCIGPKMVGHKRRLRDPRAVVDEIEDLVKMGFSNIAFSDDHFAMKREHAFAVCDEIIARKLKVDLSIFIRADAAEPELLERMRQAGCSKILYGAESGSQKIVDLIKKRTDLEMLREKVKLALSMDFQVQVTFIMGLPGETPETLQQTFDYARSLNTFFGMHILAPLPGSELFVKADELGLKIFHNDWSLFDANHVVSKPEGISVEELEKSTKWLDEAYDKLVEMELAAWRRGELTEKKLIAREIHERKLFYWELLRSGFFDGADSIANGNGNALGVFVERATAIRKISAAEAERWFKYGLETGDLSIEKTPDGSKLTLSDKIYIAK